MSISDDQLREMWRAGGGTFYGPRVEHGDMEEAKLLPFLRQLVEGRDKYREEAEDQRHQQVAHHASMSGTIDDLRTRLSTAQAMVATDQAAIVKHQSHITGMINLLTEARATLLRVATAFQQQGVGASSLLEMVKCIDQVIKGKS